MKDLDVTAPQPRSARLHSAGELIALKPSDKENSELAAIKVPDAQPYAYPVLFGNRIFIKDKDSGAVYTID